MIPLNHDARFRFFLPFTGGNEDATALIVQLGHLARVADDLADGDADDRQESVAEILRLALVEIPTNPFFDAHRGVLWPMMATTIATWQVSNRFHRRVNDARRQAFGYVMRDSCDQLAMQICALCEGWAAAPDVFDAIFEARHHDNPETLADWMKEAP